MSLCIRQFHVSMAIEKDFPIVVLVFIFSKPRKVSKIVKSAATSIEKLERFFALSQF